MKESFSKGFGFIMGMYAAFVVIDVICGMLPEKYKEKIKNKPSDFEEEA